MNNHNLKVEYISISVLKASEYNPRTHDRTQSDQLKESLKRFGFVDPVICNSAAGRENIIIGGHFRVDAAKELSIDTIPVVYINIPDLEREKELNLRLNKNLGSFDLNLLAEFDETILADIGFDSEELDEIFPVEETPEQFNLKEELEKLDIDEVTAQKGDMYESDGFRLLIGDSTVEADMLKLMGDEKVDHVMTDPPYNLDYLHGKKKKGDAVTGFGAKRDRRYLETDSLPPDFTEKWMTNVAAVAKPDFSIICYENWKNVREIWGEMEKRWKVRNMIVWHLPNRMQGFSAKYKFFSKHDIAMVGTSDDHSGLNLEPEEDLLQNEYETALYATCGKPGWEPYEKGKKYCPTDFVEHIASDEKSSGQGVIFGCKPIEILIPYIKVLTKRGDLVLEPFGGSGSTAVAALKLKRRAYVMEKSPVYAMVILRRIEILTGKKPVKI